MTETPLMSPVLEPKVYGHVVVAVVVGGKGVPTGGIVEIEG